MAYSNVSFFVKGPSTLTDLTLPDFTDVASLKQRLYTATGIPPATQLLSCQGAPLQSDNAPLSAYSLDVSTSDSALLSALESYNDAEAADKFELTDQEYGARRDTVRAYKQRMGIGRFAPTPEDAGPEPAPEATPENVKIGERCQDTAGRRGTIAFVGQVSELPAPKNAAAPVWVGVQWDEPVPKPAAAPQSQAGFAPALSGLSVPLRTKNDGCVQGVRYFICREGYGSFVRPDRIEVGDQFSKEAWEEELEDL